MIFLIPVNISQISIENPVSNNNPISLLICEDPLNQNKAVFELCRVITVQPLIEINILKEFFCFLCRFCKK